MEVSIEFDRTVTFRTTIEADTADAAYEWALDMGDQLDGPVVAMHSVDEFSVVVREPAVTG